MIIAAITVPVPGVAAQSEISAELCYPSKITISQPPSDGTVNNSVVHISGTVSNSNQIEVYVDDGYSGVVPIGISDTAYDTNVTVPAGTHTIKLIAIDGCTDIADGQANLVVTYQPPNTGTKSTTTTALPEGGVVIGSDDEVEVTGGGLLLREADNFIKSVAQWMNFRIDDQAESQSRLTGLRASGLIIGIIFVLIGVFGVFSLRLARATSGFYFTKIIETHRPLLIRITFIVMGIGMILLALFV